MLEAPADAAPLLVAPTGEAPLREAPADAAPLREAPVGEAPLLVAPAREDAPSRVATPDAFDALEFPSVPSPRDTFSEEVP